MKDKKIQVEKVGKIPGSARELTLNDEFVNEIKEHLETVPELVGPRGRRGEDGEAGRRGRRGLKGETGETGDHGVDGKTGDEGVEGKDGAIGKTGRQGEDGTIGKSGRQGEVGAQGPKGDKGDKGEQGRTGPAGGRGGMGKSANPGFSEIILNGTNLEFNRDKAGPLGPDISVDLSSLITPSFQGLGSWRFRTETAAPPASGQLRFDNADPELATELFLHEVNAIGEDLANFLGLIEVGDTIYFQDATDASKFIVVEVGSTTDSGVYFTFGIANVSQQGGAISQNTLTRVVAIISGGGGGAGLANNAVQARRTTNLTLTTAFVDVTLDATDIETDAAVIEHDAVTDRIVAKIAGTYEIFYQFNIQTVTGQNSVIAADGRVRLNDGGTGIVGSLAQANGKRQHGGPLPGHLSCKFIATLAANDFLTLQVQKTDLQNAEAYFINEVSLQVTRLI